MKSQCDRNSICMIAILASATCRIRRVAVLFLNTRLRHGSNSNNPILRMILGGEHGTHNRQRLGFGYFGEQFNHERRRAGQRLHRHRLPRAFRKTHQRRRHRTTCESRRGTPQLFGQLCGERIAQHRHQHHRTGDSNRHRPVLRATA